MTSLWSIETAAQDLRRCLQAPLPEHRVLCALRFFEKAFGAGVPERHPGAFEAYLREFIPPVAEAARKSNVQEFFPREIDQIRRLVEHLKRINETVVSPADRDALAALCLRSQEATHAPVEADHGVLLAGLLVETNPALGLDPRGRLLWLRVTASAEAPDVRSDIVHIFNTTTAPDDPFREQADIAVRVARDYLARRYGVSRSAHYRFDFEILPATTALTGPSLGLAFAVGAIAAVARTEVLRDRIAIAPDVAFSGALTADGRLAPVDGEGLRLKLDRAFHSGLRYVALPREHLADAWEYVKSLEKDRHATLSLQGRGEDSSPSPPSGEGRGEGPPDASRTLNLVGADTVDAVLEDRNLVTRSARSLPNYGINKTRRALNRPKVGVPMLVVLLALLGYFTAPLWPWLLDTNPASVVIEGKGIKVQNRRGRVLWTKAYACDSLLNARELWVVYDLDGDQRNDVLFLPSTTTAAPDNAKLEVFSDSGKQRFRRDCTIWCQYPGDCDSGNVYDASYVNVVLVRGRPVIVTAVVENNPSRCHIRLWSSTGNSLGWYVNAGVTFFQFAKDLDADSIEDLLFTAYNVRMRAAALFVLRADSSHGVSPPYTDPQYDLSFAQPGNQLHYMMFPKTDVSLADTLLYNAPSEIRDLTDRGFRFDVCEGQGRNNRINYYLDSNLRPVRVDVSDSFKAHRLSMVDDRRLPSVHWEEYFNHLRDTVTYWTRTGWMTERQHATRR